MLKILSTKQIKEWDAYTIENEPIASIDLMERACRAFVNWFTERFDAAHKVGIVCGTGNNGGDGLGVARLLHEWGYPVKVWIVRGLVPESEDFKINLKRLSSVDVAEIISDTDRNLFGQCDILIDAIFGSGLSRPVEGIYAQAMDCINHTAAIRVAIDIPSGLMADSHSEEPVVEADYTISFQTPKLAFYLPENSRRTGEWVTVNIGLHKEFLKRCKTSHAQLQLRDIKAIKKRRSRFDHKGNYGRALLISGRYGKMGATVLSARAAMRSGLGLLTVHIPGCGYTILQTAVPEAMASIDDHEKLFTHPVDTAKYDAVGIGPGLGTESQTVKAFAQLLEGTSRPVVIDADGLNMLAANRELLHLIPPASILTPHPKEFERLTRSWRNDFERLQIQREFAAETNAFVLLKGAFTSIATPEGDVFFNSTGNPGMATAGSGDVLTGILTGLLAQGYTPQESALAGVYIHGMAGDYAAREKSQESMIASDIVEHLPQAFTRLSY